MNKFDQFVKHKIKAKYYIRYADDFVFLSRDKDWLISIVLVVQDFLNTELKLDLHPKKLSIETLESGIDFLGWVHFPHHRVLRTTAKRRIMKRIREHPTHETYQSYRGLLQHGNTYSLRNRLASDYFL